MTRGLGRSERAGPGAGDEAALAPVPGTVAPEVQAEFPGLRLDWVSVSGSRRPSTPSVASSLARLASRYRGAQVIAMRTQPIPHAYRTFFRQIGLDPDVDRVPAEQAAVARLRQGGFRSIDLVADALLLALIETGVPVWALDAAHVDVGGPGIRTAFAGERLGAGSDAERLDPGGLVVADAGGVHARLFGPVAPGHEVTSRTERITLFSVGVEGVPAIHVEEALWVSVEAIQAS